MFLDRNEMSLYEQFSRSFEIVRVSSEPLFEEVLRLRYQVYCVENRLADRKKFTNCMEHDLYDERSRHRLIRHKGTGTYVAHVRLIFPNPRRPEDCFPIEKYCKINQREMVRGSLAEVSRFLISKEREQQVILISATPGVGSGPIYRKEDGPNNFLLLHGLIAAGLRTAIEINSSSLYACIGMPLFRLLRRLGIPFFKIGPQVDYHGKRSPYFGSTEQILSGIYTYRPDLWNLVTKNGELAPQIKGRFPVSPERCNL
jgi:N-acyl amino acid synthase of PEP-CTERM/exosortase system